MQKEFYLNIVFSVKATKIFLSSDTYKKQLKPNPSSTISCILALNTCTCDAWPKKVLKVLSCTVKISDA